VTRGTEVYTERCSTCHGKGGEGTPNGPAVVGATALSLDPPAGAKVRKSQFVTVADVAEFVVKNMPGDAPGSLGEDDYFAVLAFDLHANGIDLDQKLDSALAASLTIPRN
jgi:cytochrome c